MTPPGCGIIPFTSAAESTLRIGRPLARAEPVKQLTQRHQIDRSKRRLAAGHMPKRIHWSNIGQSSGDRAKPPVVARIDNPVLAPMPTPADQIELATTVRMKRVRDAHLEAACFHTTCSRQ